MGVKNGRETLSLHVKKCKKRSKIGFHAHFRFHAKKKTLGSNSARENIIPTRENSEKYAREIFFCTREKISKKAGKCPLKWQVRREKSEKSEKKWAWNTHFAREKI